MKSLSKRAFTLVELLVVITILAIISVVAYQNFWWAVDKANSGRKINDVSTIETSLQQYRVDNQRYPAVDEYDANNNLWWYNSLDSAAVSNKVLVRKNGAEINELVSAGWGWTIKYKDWSQQIWAKWTISQETVGKLYMTKDLYDPEIWDVKVRKTNSTFIESWVWRYVYAIYRKPSGSTWQNEYGTYYNIAFTIKKDWSDTYLTKIVWDYDNESCFEERDNCPSTLIWEWNNFLVDWQEHWKDSSGNALTNAYGSNSPNQWIPYSALEFETAP